MSRWQRLARRRRIRAALFGWRSARIAAVAYGTGRHEMLTQHIIVSKKLLHELPPSQAAGLIARTAEQLARDATLNYRGAARAHA